MQGRSHIAVNAVSGVVVNGIFHVVGTAYSWHQITSLLASPQLSATLHSSQLLYKLTYYVVVVLTARLPDIDLWPAIGRFTGGHRGCTHSCLGVLLLTLFYFATFTLGLSWLTTH